MRHLKRSGKPSLKLFLRWSSLQNKPRLRGPLNANLMFSVSPVLAASRQGGKFLVLQGVDGSWRQLEAKDKRGSVCMLYADADKNVQQVRREALSDNLQNMLKEQRPEVESSRQKSMAQSPRTESADGFKVERNCDAANRFAVDREAAVGSLRPEDLRQQPEWV